jgi:hypothetical protein
LFWNIGFLAQLSKYLPKDSLPSENALSAASYFFVSSNCLVTVTGNELLTEAEFLALEAEEKVEK